MLSQDELTKALKDGQGQADTCDHFCRVTAQVDENTYTLAHNHIGSKTDAQVVHAEAVLKMDADKLAGRIRVWIAGLHHSGEKTNLNAAMGALYYDEPSGLWKRDATVRASRGPAVMGWPWKVQITDAWPTTGALP